MKKAVKVVLLICVFAIVLSSAVLADKKQAEVTGFVGDDIWMFDDLTIFSATLEESGNVTIVKGVSPTDALVIKLKNTKAEYEYALLLVDGQSVSTITKENVIRFVSQKSDNSTLTFEVKPLLPENTTELTLLIVSNEPGFKTIKIPIIYAKAEMIEYSLGMVTVNDSSINSLDALFMLQHSVEKAVLTGGSFLAADVNRDGVVNASDALWTLEYSVEIRQSFE